MSLPSAHSSRGLTNASTYRVEMREDGNGGFTRSMPGCFGLEVVYDCRGRSDRGCRLRHSVHEVLLILLRRYRACPIDAGHAVRPRCTVRPVARRAARRESPAMSPFVAPVAILVGIDVPPDLLPPESIDVPEPLMPVCEARDRRLVSRIRWDLLRRPAGGNVLSVILEMSGEERRPCLGGQCRMPR